jgi:hypothetical protein
MKPMSLVRDRVDVVDAAAVVAQPVKNGLKSKVQPN